MTLLQAIKPDTCRETSLVRARAQAEGLLPGDRVLLVGITSEPQACIAKDADAMRSLFSLRLCVPMLSRVDSQVCCSAEEAADSLLGLLGRAFSGAKLRTPVEGSDSLLRAGAAGRLPGKAGSAHSSEFQHR